MPRLTAALFLLLSLVVLPCASAGEKLKVQHLVFKFANKTREAYFFVPPQQGNLPVLVLLHGSGRDGRVMIDEWKDLAAREGIVLAAPDALHDMEWNPQLDSAAFLHEVVNQARELHAIDDNRIYLFGHSAGAQYALILALIDPNYYAAAAIHAGTLPAALNPALLQPRRHMPLAIWSGDLDPYFPVDEVRETKRRLDAHGWNVQLSVMAQHDHNYYAVSSTVNPRAWQFLSATRLTDEPLSTKP
jgi:poly(3-hydroxybutyrate) depolymerase